jgi:hypothetical protein
MPTMIAPNLVLRTALAASLLLALAASSRAQDLYKSRADMLHAEAANKQANATVITAIALYEKTQAEIARLNEDTREKGSHNNLLEADTFYKKRAQYHAYQATQRPKTEQVQAYVAQARAVSATKITAQQLCSPDGNISWPTLLKTAPYDATRRQVDALVNCRTAENSGAGSHNCVQAVAQLDVLKAKLRANIRSYSSHDYLAARSFLNAVLLEVQRPLLPAAGAAVDVTLDKVAKK